MAEHAVNAANVAAPGDAPVETVLFVDIHPTVAESQLYDLFSQVGDVISVKVCRKLSSGLSLGYGFVNYGNPQCAQRALEELNLVPLNGKPIRITCSHKEPSMSKCSAGSIYIKNLDKEIDYKTLHEIFSSFGKILLCNIAKDPSGQSVGYGFVQFAGEESAQKAIAELNGMLLNRKEVYVGSYLSKQERELFADKSNFTNVFVKNFCGSITEDDLKNIFGEFGLITSTSVMRNEDGTSKCFGFVNFVNTTDAARAVSSLNGQIFNEKKWYVGRAQRKLERQLEMKCHLESLEEAFDKRSNLYVKNLDDSVDEEKLRELFSPFGSVTSCRVMRDGKGISTGRGWVAFSLPEEASRALSEMNGKILGSNPLHVAIATRVENRRARLQNSDKEINHKAAVETFSSSGNIVSYKVATDASIQSGGCGFMQFSGEDSAMKAIKEHNGMLLSGKQAYGQFFVNMQERELSIDKLNFTKVYVKNFCESTTEDELKDIFGEFGVITSTEVMRSRDGTSKCFGFVNFVNTKDAARAVESLNGQMFNEKKWYVVRAQKNFERQLEMKHHLESLKEAFDKRSNLYVKNLDDSVDEEKLRELFSPFGSVTSCRVMRDGKGISTGRGFVAFSLSEEASRALSKMNGKILGSKPLHVVLALRKEDIRARLQNLKKEIDHKALPEAFFSSGNAVRSKVAANASGQSMGCDFVRFAGEASAKKVIEEHNGMLLNKKEACDDPFVNKQERDLPIDKSSDRDIDDKAPDETFSSCKVSTDAAAQSIGFGHVKFAGMESAQKATGELNSILGELNGLLLDGKQVYAPFPNKRENKLLVYKVNCTAVIVENFLEPTTEDDLKNIFCEFGTVTSTLVMRNEDGISKCSGFVNFENADDATRAVESLNGQKFHKGKYYVGRAQKNCKLKHQSEQCVKEAVIEGSNQYVKNLDNSSGGQKLSEVFSPFRSVMSCEMMQDRKGISRGRGFVTLAWREQSSRAFGMLPSAHGHCYPPGVTFLLQYEMDCLPLHNVGVCQPIPFGPLASVFANASPLGSGRQVFLRFSS